MNVVFLSPQFPDNYYHFCANLHKLGATVLGIADEKFENLHDDLKSVLTEYYQVDDMQDYDQLVRAMGYFTHKYGKIDCLESHSEQWLEVDARLRTDFNIVGIKNDVIKQIKRRVLVKKKFIKAGVTVAPGKVVRTLKDAITLIKKIGYPVVAKSDSGERATDTYKINNEQDLIDFFASKSPAEYFIESFITGQRYTFDGLVDRDGTLVFYTCHTFSETTMSGAKNDTDTYYYSLRDIPKNLEEAGKNALKAFDIQERFFHFEFIITADDEVVGLEAHMSPLGGLTMDMFNFANDVDLYYDWASIVMNGSTTIDYNRKYHCGYIGRNMTQSYAHSHEEIMEKFGQLIVQKDIGSGIFTAEVGNCGYLARSPELNDIVEIIDFIHAKS